MQKYLRFQKGQLPATRFNLLWVKYVCLLVMSTMSLPVVATGINVPDSTARETLREQERQRQLREQQEKRPDVRLQRAPALKAPVTYPKQESPCFIITEIKLVGDAAEQFLFALTAVTEGEDKAIGRCLGVQGINVVLTRVQNAVVAAGFITTRILAAPQDLKTGVLELTVIPGRVRNIRFQQDAAQRLLDSALPLTAGQILNLRDIEQGLENFKRVPTAEADFQIEPARDKNALPGDSDLVIRYQQNFPLRATLSLDDGGSESTGRNQAGLTISYDNPLSLNDLFYVSLNSDFEGGDASDRGTDGYTVHYSIPFGYWLLSLTGSKFDFRQTVAAVGQDIRFSGETKTGEVRLSRVVYRDAQRRITGFIKAYIRSSKNFINSVEVEIQRRRTGGYELGIAHREFIGASTLDVNLAYRRGTGAFNSLEAPEDQFGEGATRPELYTADVFLNLPFAIGSQRFRYTANLRIQHNITPLVPQDRFSIGGRYTVRGFDGETVFSADRGWFIRNDVGVALGQSGQEFYVGIDYGEVDGQSSELLIGKSLTGAVLGLRGGYKKMAYNVFVGKPLSKPNGFDTADTTAGFNVSLFF